MNRLVAGACYLLIYQTCALYRAENDMGVLRARSFVKSHPPSPVPAGATANAGLSVRCLAQPTEGGSVTRPDSSLGAGPCRRE